MLYGALSVHSITFITLFVLEESCEDEFRLYHFLPNDPFRKRHRGELPKSVLNLGFTPRTLNLPPILKRRKVMEIGLKQYKVPFPSPSFARKKI